MAANAPGRASFGALHGVAADETVGPAGRGARQRGEDHDERQSDDLSARSSELAVLRRSAEHTVGRLYF